MKKPDYLGSRIVKTKTIIKSSALTLQNSFERDIAIKSRKNLTDESYLISYSMNVVFRVGFFRLNILYCSKNRK